MSLQQDIPAGRRPLSDLVPVIETKRMTLRPLNLSDEKALTAYWTGERSRPNDGPLTESEIVSRMYVDAARWYYHGLGPWIAVERNTGNRLVACSLTPSAKEGEAHLGWDVLTASAEGFGYATEAAGALLSHGRALGFTDIRAAMYADNDRSRRLAEKLGGVWLGDYTRNERRAVIYTFYGIVK